MSFNGLRKLPTFCFDERNSSDRTRLPQITENRYDEFLLSESAEKLWIPPRKAIRSIVGINTSKRSKAFSAALASAGENLPPRSVIPSIMNHGSGIPGVRDEYLDDDYPSQEVFAYNRLGKKSMLNREFGKRCIEAMQYAYPDSIELSQFDNLRVRVHRIVRQQSNDEALAVVSTKETIDKREHNGRTSALIARVTGVARLEHPDMDNETRAAIEELADSRCDTQRMIAHKALLADMLRSADGDGLILPVIQTMYQTQQ